MLLQLYKQAVHDNGCLPEFRLYSCQIFFLYLFSLPVASFLLFLPPLIPAGDHGTPQLLQRPFLPGLLLLQSFTQVTFFFREFCSAAAIFPFTDLCAFWVLSPFSLARQPGMCALFLSLTLSLINPQSFTDIHGFTYCAFLCLLLFSENPEMNSCC